MRPSMKTCTTCGLHVVEQALVVGHQQHADVRRGRGVDALGDDLEGVDVEAGVGLVEQREAGLEHEQLQDLEALLLAAGEAVVEVAAGEGRVHRRGPPCGASSSLRNSRTGTSAPRTRGHGRAQERRHRHARDRHRVLEGEEHPLARLLVGRRAR